MTGIATLSSNEPEAPAHEPEGSLAVEVPPQRLDPIVDLYPA